MVRVHVLYCDSGMCTCSVLSQCSVSMFCIVTVVHVHVLYCDSGTCTCFYCDSGTLHVLFCDSGTCTCSLL